MPDDLNAMRAELAGLREDVQHLHRRLIDAEDRRDLARLLPAAAKLVGARSWTAEELAGRTSTDDSPAAAEVAQVLAEYLSERGGLRQFGRFLGRVLDVPMRGLRLQRVGEVREGVLYAIAGFEGPETRLDSGAPASRRAR